MTDSITITDLRARLGQSIRRASHGRERIAVTDHGQTAAVIINAEELAELEEQLALARYELRKLAGTVEFVPSAEARARLGLPPHQR
ncbi:MAG: type II toxin-antitoxin system prevent-host-death family antitoxin [Sporichthyaceae bacterium]